MLLPGFTVFQVERLHMTATQISILVMCGMIASAITYPIFGRVVDPSLTARVWASAHSSACFTRSAMPSLRSGGILFPAISS